MTADAVLARWPVFDGHNDLPYRLRTLGHDSSVALERLERPRTELDRLDAASVGAEWWGLVRELAAEVATGEARR